MPGPMFLMTSGDELVEMTLQPYDSEIRLQRMIAAHPNLLTSDRGGATGQWLLIDREVQIASEEDGVSRWSIDHVFIDQDAVPTIVEVKRSSDTRIRREVVGQMLDYAANAVTYLSAAKLRLLFEADAGSVD